MTGALKKQKDCGNCQQERRKQEASKQFNHCAKKRSQGNKNDTNLKVYLFDKGSEFFIMKKEDAIKRIEEKIEKSIMIDYDPTKPY